LALKVPPTAEKIVKKKYQREYGLPNTAAGASQTPTRVRSGGFVPITYIFMTILVSIYDLPILCLFPLMKVITS
jgi:hypothetical protein